MTFREKIVTSIFNLTRTQYTLNEVFGCSEKFPPNCPTFLTRGVHKRFLNELKNNNIIVVYGESRQGKTWTIERYCPQQIRIGCTSEMGINQIKIDMLHAIGIEVREVEYSVTKGYSREGFGSLGMAIPESLLKFGRDFSAKDEEKETIKTKYPTVDINNSEQFLKSLEENQNNCFFVFDNFHYLSLSVQQAFCSLLKEFNYRGIKVIIVGVWKESSKITALAPDLVNRCVHIDIGSWGKEELKNVTLLGEQALNISIEKRIVNYFIECCANNIGIYKDLLQKYCQKCGVVKTQKNLTFLDNTQARDEAIDIVIREAYDPLYDRLKNLSMTKKKNAKNVRKKIIVAILSLIIQKDRDVETIQNGLEVIEIQNEVNKICNKYGMDTVQPNNLMRELGNLHLRKENCQTKQNYIPLFYYDKTNQKLFVIEPTIYVLKEAKPILLKKILDDLLED